MGGGRSNGAAVVGNTITPDVTIGGGSGGAAAGGTGRSPVPIRGCTNQDQFFLFLINNMTKGHFATAPTTNVNSSNFDRSKSSLKIDLNHHLS